jgi:mRNA interferase YafQ
VRTFSRTNQFKKDVKLAGKRGKDLARLKAVLELLIDGESLPSQYKDHLLRGDFAGSRDCHVEIGLGSDIHAHGERRPCPV